MDPLSDVLSLLRPRSAISVGLDAGRDWAIRFPAHEGIKFNAVMRGACWLQVDGEPEPVRLEAGDCFLLTRGHPFRLATDTTRPAIDSAPIYEKARNGIATCNGGGDFFLVGGRFFFTDAHAGVLLDGMPAVVHVRDASAQAAVLRWSLAQLATELREGWPGGVLMAEHLAQIMLLQVLRLWLASGSGTHAGWLGAVAHPRLAHAVGAMHADPARRWTLAELAGLAGMSRTTFAVRFRDIVGQTPLDYLAGWRMRLAADRLLRTGERIAGIGFSVGYESEAAFSAAFRKMMGTSPNQYRRQKVGRADREPSSASRPGRRPSSSA